MSGSNAPIEHRPMDRRDITPSIRYQGEAIEGEGGRKGRGGDRMKNRKKEGTEIEED